MKKCNNKFEKNQAIRYRKKLDKKKRDNEIFHKNRERDERMMIMMRNWW